MSKKNEKKLDAKKLAKDRLIPRGNGCSQVSGKDMEKADAYCEPYKKFMDAAKTEREAVKTAIALAEKKGFVPFELGSKYKAGDKVTFSVYRDGDTTTVDVTLDEENQEREEAMNQLQQDYYEEQQAQQQQQQQQGGYFQWPFGW